MLKTLRVITIAVLLSSLGCASIDQDANTPEGAYAIAEEFEKSDRYEEAIRRYNQVKNKYPYSNYATRAELAVADVYYKQESYAEAQVSYQLFKELHPNYRPDYVQFKIGMSYFQQLPSTIDRDLTLANDAIYHLSDLLKKYPNSEHAEEARNNRKKAITMLAEKEEYIADFYYKRKIYMSALGRYENIINTFAGLGLDEKALVRAARCAIQIDDKPKAKKYRDILAKSFPENSDLKSLTKELQ